MANLAKSLLQPGATRQVTLQEIKYNVNGGHVASITFVMVDEKNNTVTQAFNPQAEGVLARFLTGIVSQLNAEDAERLNFFATSSGKNGIYKWKVTPEEKEANKSIIGTSFVIRGILNSRDFLNVETVLMIPEEDED